MRICSSGIAALIALLAGISLPSSAAAQQQTPAEKQAAQAPAQPPLAPNKAKIPDYPNPRTITVGVFYWGTIPGNGASILTGTQATDDETLKNLGPDHATPGFIVSVPITRTGELKFEGYVSKGDGNQASPGTLDIFTTTINPGDYLATQYQIKAGKLYLEDLLWPYKFPVSKFRLKSLWEAQWISTSTTVDAPIVNANLTTSETVETAVGSKQVILPTFGLAAEYALSPSVLLRADASGFGIPHKSDIWDADATISWRRGKIEVVGGLKAVHFKTTPNNTEYITDTLAGGFIGVNYHLQ